MATPGEVEKYVEGKGEGSIEGCFGPSSFGSLEVWEVWVWDDDEYKTRFVTVDDAKNWLYFSDFHQYNAHVSGLFVQQGNQLTALKDSRHPNLVKLYVAVAVFVASAAVLFYLIVTGIEPNAKSFGVLTSLVASGGYMFFGAWLR